MSSIGSIHAATQRALIDFQMTVAATEAWRDAQRASLEKSRLEPIMEASTRFVTALGQLDREVDDALKVLGRPVQ